MLNRCIGILIFYMSQSAHADPVNSQNKIFIRDIRIFAVGHQDFTIDIGLSTVFKSILDRFHYSVNDCDDLLTPLRQNKNRVPDEISAQEEKLLMRSHCNTPPGAIVYDAELVLGVDPELGNRRAVLRFIPVFESSSPSSGGYAQKPGEPKLSWDDIISRGIERTLGGFNDPTSIQVTVPSETSVGDTLEIDARNSWDEDGDTFELRWQVITTGCIGTDITLPADQHQCPIGTNGPVEVFTQSGKKANMREFRVPIVGDYKIAVHAKIGDHEETEHVFHVRAYPRRSRLFFSRIGFVGLPDDFFESGHRAAPALLGSAGYLRRVYHRIGLFGWYEEMYLGGSFGITTTVRDLDISRSGAVQLGFEVANRLMDRTGRLGLASIFSMNGFASHGMRGDRVTVESGLFLDFFNGVYIAFAENYMDKPSMRCTSMCPSIAIGPTFTSMVNLSTHKFALTVGGEFMMAVEF